MQKKTGWSLEAPRLFSVSTKFDSQLCADRTVQTFEGGVAVKLVIAQTPPCAKVTHIAPPSER